MVVVLCAATLAGKHRHHQWSVPLTGPIKGPTQQGGGGGVGGVSGMRAHWPGKLIDFLAVAENSTDVDQSQTSFLFSDMNARGGFSGKVGMQKGAWAEGQSASAAGSAGSAEAKPEDSADAKKPQKVRKVWGGPSWPAGVAVVVQMAIVRLRWPDSLLRI